MRKLRPSEVDIVLACPAAATLPEIEIDVTSDAAHKGQAVHEALATWIDDGATGEPDPDPAAAKYAVDVREVARLCSYAPRALAAIRGSVDLRDMQAEVELTSDLFRGRADVLADVAGPDGETAGLAVIDWKTGRDSSHGKPGQMVAYAYAYAADEDMGHTSGVYTAEVWLDEQVIIERRVDSERMASFTEQVQEALARPTRFSPGQHCRFCRRAAECRARDAYIRSSCTALAEVPGGALSREQVATLWPHSRALKSALAQYEKVVDEMLAEGWIQLADGSKLDLVERAVDVIDVRRAWPVLAERFAEGDIADMVKITKGAMLDAAAARAPRGGKAKAKAALMADLIETGAVTKKTSRVKKLFKP